MKKEIDHQNCQTFNLPTQDKNDCGAALRDEVARPNSENTLVFSVDLFNGLSGPLKRSTRRWVWLPRPALFSCCNSSTMGPRRRKCLLSLASPFQRIIVVRDPALLCNHETDTWPPLHPTMEKALCRTLASTALCQSARKGSQCNE